MQSTRERGDMNIRILFDKLSQNDAYRTGWGVSFLVGETVLFDTGENGDWLIDNIGVMGVDIDKIDAVVISHDHWDHTGGLWRLLESKPSILVYSCSGFGDSFKQKVHALDGTLIETDTVAEIAPHIYVGPEIIGAYNDAPISEHALIIDGRDGISIITGCAHPSIVNMVRRIMKHFTDKKISLVMGGFHLMKEGRNRILQVIEDFKKMGVESVGPTHCSGEKAEMLFHEAYRKQFVNVVVGDVIVVA
jgi:7,8-dihydropterin-6-yl-methyl-4-(beta-D-ribofuranosyl)aminobenzene 5'-phosphate synthase